MPRLKKTMMDSVINFSLAPLASSSPQAAPKAEKTTFEEWAINFKETTLKEKAEFLGKLDRLFSRVPDSGGIPYYSIDDENPMTPETEFSDEIRRIINEHFSGDNNAENIPPRETKSTKRGTSERKSRSRSAVSEMQRDRFKIPSAGTSTLKRGNAGMSGIGSNTRAKRSRSSSSLFSPMVSNPLLCTPQTRGRPYKIASVTPGPGRLETPAVLRKPVVGEQVISLSGSPILVPSSNTVEEPSVHIPLPDGRVFAVMAQDDLNDLNAFPDVNPETMHKLKMLHKFLEEKVFSGPNA